MINWGEEVPVGTLLDLSHNEEHLLTTGIGATLFAVVAYEEGRDKHCRLIIAQEVRDDMVVENGHIIRFNTGSPLFMGAEAKGVITIRQTVLINLVDDCRNGSEIVASIETQGGHVTRSLKTIATKLNAPAETTIYTIVGIRGELVLGEDMDVRKNIQSEAARRKYQRLPLRATLLLRERFPIQEPFGYAQVVVLPEQIDAFRYRWFELDGVVLRPNKGKGWVGAWSLPGGVRRDREAFFLFSISQ